MANGKPQARLRARSTAIVEYEGAILLTETKDGLLLLPGGGRDRHESPMEAALRELREETALAGTSCLYLFSYESPTNHHSVFWVGTTGSPVAGDDAVALHHFRGETGLSDRMSPATRSILARYQEIRQAHAGIFEFLVKLD